MKNKTHKRIRTIRDVITTDGTVIAKGSIGYISEESDVSEIACFDSENSGYFDLEVEVFEDDYEEFMTRIQIALVYSLLEDHYNVGGILVERKSNRIKRKEDGTVIRYPRSTNYQILKMGILKNKVYARVFKDNCIENFTKGMKALYDKKVDEYIKFKGDIWT